MDKSVEKPYKHQEYPKMVFHLTTGEYKICDCKEDIPEGYGAQKDVKLEDIPATEDTNADDLKAAYDKGFADGLAAGAKKDKKAATAKPKVGVKKDEKKPAKKPVKEDKAASLEGLKLTREEAEQILKEDGVEFDKDTTDDALASKIEKLLEDDKSK